MRGRRPCVQCDGLDGECGNWDVDFYEETATTVNGIRMTTEQRTPGWLSTDAGDWCPDHTHEADQ